MNEGVMKNSCSKGSPGAVEKQRKRLNQRQKAGLASKKFLTCRLSI